MKAISHLLPLTGVARPSFATQDAFDLAFIHFRVLRFENSQNHLRKLAIRLELVIRTTGHDVGLIPPRLRGGRSVQFLRA